MDSADRAPPRAVESGGETREILLWVSRAVAGAGSAFFLIRA